jgi:hypothetical protein
METRALDRTLALLAMLAALTVALMVAGIVTTRSSQDFFQSARTVEAYSAHLAAPLSSLGLRLNLGLDNLFMIFYGAFFAVLAARLRGMLDPRLLGTALAALMLTVLLDSFENHHIMTMVHSIEEGLPLSAAEGEMQMIASAIKFHASYLGVLLFSFGFLQFGKLGRAIAIALGLHSLRGADLGDAGRAGQGAGARTNDLLRVRLHPVGDPGLFASQQISASRELEPGDQGERL